MVKRSNPQQPFCFKRLTPRTGYADVGVFNTIFFNLIIINTSVLKCKKRLFDLLLKLKSDIVAGVVNPEELNRKIIQ